MMILRSLVLVLVGVACSAATAMGQLYTVPGTHPTIQSAVNAAETGAVITVAPGTYNERITLRDRDITIRSSGGAAVTTINGQNIGRALTIASRNSSATVIEGFTITGGGVQVVGLCSPTIKNCVFNANNPAFTADGMAMRIEQGSPIIESCTFTNNGGTGANFGGAISIVGYPRPFVTVRQSTFTNNRVLSGDPRGGAVFLASGEAVFENCTFTGNQAAFGGGAIHVRDDSPRLTVRQCTFTGNTATSRGGAIEDISYQTAGWTIEDSTFTSNTSGDWGGAIASTNGTSTGSRQLLRSTFTTNKSQNNGGAFSMDSHASATVVIDECQFTGNAQSSDTSLCCHTGGSICLMGSSTMTMTDCTVQNGRSSSGAGLTTTGSSTVTITDSTFDHNLATQEGGALRAGDSSSMTLIRCVLTANQASQGGAAAAWQNSSGQFVLDRCTVANNSAASVGALHVLGGAVTLRNTRFEGNYTLNSVGAIHGIDLTSFTMQGCLVTDNTANQGGALYLRNVSGTATITNSTIAANSNWASDQCGIRVDTPLSLQIRNCIIWGNGNTFDTPPFVQINGGALAGVVVSNSIVQNGFAGTGNTSGDPLFVNAAGGDLRLQAGSPAIDTGANADVPGPLTTDVAGAPRIVNGNAAGGAEVDRGAFEAQDCNSNAIPDHVDIASGAVTDYNANGIPDACDENFTINLRTSQQYSSLASAILASAPGDELLSAPLQFSTPLSISFANRLVTVTSMGNILQRLGGVIDLTNGASLATAPSGTLTVRGTLRSANNAAADVRAGALVVNSGSLLLARAGSALNIAAPTTVQGSVRVDPGAVLTVDGAATLTGTATLLDDSTLITSSSFTLSAASSLVATTTTLACGPLSVGGVAQFSDTIILASTLTVPVSGDFTFYGEVYADVTNSGLSTYSSQSSVFGDYTNTVGATTVIRGGTLALFGNLSNSGTITGTLCTTCRNGAPYLDVTGSLILGPGASLVMPFADSAVYVGGSFDHAIDSNTRFDLSIATLQLEGAGIEQTLEVASTDIGPSPLGLDRTLAGHYPIGTLEIGPSLSTVRLVDAHDNDGLGQSSCEALYVSNLVIHAGSRLINPTCRIYYGTLTNNGLVDVPGNLVPIGGGACNLADITDVGSTGAGPDGQLTLDDILLFINSFSEGDGCPGLVPCNPADVTSVGGPPEGPDGQLTLDDILAFINAFGEGC